jgi:hypothetical protein
MNATPCVIRALLDFRMCHWEDTILMHIINLNPLKLVDLLEKVEPKDLEDIDEKQNADNIIKIKYVFYKSIFDEEDQIFNS